jgi:hypothetical protein
MRKIVLWSIIIICWTLYSLVASDIDSKPVIWWNFEASGENILLDNITKINDTINGYFYPAEGVIGGCIKFDGYTTSIIRKAPEAPQLEDGFTFEAWIALQTLPWNWTAIINQGGNVIPGKEVTLLEPDLKHLRPGLVGAHYGEPDLTDAQSKEELLSMDSDWTGGEKTWSSRWRGYIEAPFTGEINFYAEADDGLQLILNDQLIIDGLDLNGSRTGKMAMVKGEKYPVILLYSNDHGPSYLRLFWSWDGQERVLIPFEVLGYSERDDILARWEIVPPKSPEKEFEPRIFFGIDAHGHLGLKLNIADKWYECVSQKTISLLKWNHVAASFDKNQGIYIYLNGKQVGRRIVNGVVTPSKGADILIGKSHQKMAPVGSERKASANWLSDMVIDGLLDEVKIYDRALTAQQIENSFKAVIPEIPQPLSWRKMPAGPDNLPSRFDATYTRLKYAEEWEQFWRVDDHPDILVHFDNSPIRLIFWRGTSYGGAWVTENGIWMGDQSLERVGKGKSPWGCAEHMSDKQTRYSNVRMIEKNNARIVIQWRYAISDITYAIFGTNVGTGWGEWADEYYTIYPDGVSTRHQILWTNYLSHEWQETIVLNQPGTRPEDNIELNALTLANMKGESKTYSWENGTPHAFSEPDNPTIQITNLKSEYKPYIIFEPGANIKSFDCCVRKEYSHFPWWNHWPVAQLPNDGRRAMGPDRPSHSSLSQSIEESKVIHKQDDGSYTAVTLIGMTNEPIKNLASLARSWNTPPKLTVAGNGFSSKGYDKFQRAYVLDTKIKNKPSTLKIKIAATQDSPVLNPAFIISDWGNMGAYLEINGKNISTGKSFRFGHRNRMEGSDLIVWIQTTSTKPLTITLQPSEK